MAESDPHGYAPSSGRRSCEDPDCTLCGTAPGLVWKSGSFCSHGRWTPLPPPPPPLDALWRNLPRELLTNIFSRLPTSDIASLRTLSHDWRAATSSSSLFTRQCKHRNLLAMIGFRADGTCWTRALDLTSRQWHAFDIPSVPPLYRNAIRVFDGGLACFVPCGLASNHDPVLICNPLTRQRRYLPLPNLVGNQPRMAQLRVNPATGAYTVTLVGLIGVAPDLHHRWEQNSPLAAEVYHSTSNSWTASGSGETLGFTYWWYKHSPTPMSMRLSVYNSATSKLAEYASSPELHSSLAHHLDDLFLLQSWPGRVKVVRRPRESSGSSSNGKEAPGRWRGEEGAGSDGKARVRDEEEVVEKGRLWKCHAFGTLRVCRSFFVVLGNHVDREGAYFLTVYDRHAKTWSDDFAFDSKGRHSVSPLDLYEFGVGELRWDACP